MPTFCEYQRFLRQAHTGSPKTASFARLPRLKSRRRNLPNRTNSNSTNTRRRLTQETSMFASGNMHFLERLRVSAPVTPTKLQSSSQPYDAMLRGARGGSGGTDIYAMT